MQPEPLGMPPAVDFNALYEMFFYDYTNSLERRAERPRGIFHPSSGLHRESGLCRRQLVFELLWAPLSKTNIPTILCKVLDAGTNRHVGLQKAFHNMAKARFMGIAKFEDEVHCVHNVLPLRGHMDGLVTTMSGYRYALDFKTWGSKSCAKTFEPEWKHKLQLNTYMGIKKVKAGYMAYENKDNQMWLGPMEKFRVNFSEKLYKETEDFCWDVLDDVDRKELPEFSETDCKACLTFCAYTAICKAERNGEVGWDDYDMRSTEGK